ncbi:MAG TPA: oxidoreductase-like domain-containing protein [Candidatus Competibacteraceae bacterium]|nr:oxidoreductase-like domain-containing protein [Candidatus Competibacteraceae bacterium]
MSLPEAPLLIAPEPPVEGSCCGCGCERCVWVYYDEALRRYEAALAQRREPQSNADVFGDSGIT